MADEKKPDDKRADDERKDKSDKAAEDLTPTPTQAEMDKIMSGLSDEDLAKAKKPEAKNAPEQLPPTMTQAENDAAIKAAAPGEFPEGSTDPQKAEREEKEAKRKKELEAEQGTADYKTRTATPTKK